MNILIIGTGNVGLITGACLAHVGNNVICYDIDKEKIDNLKNGKIDIYEDGLEKIVSENLDKNLFFSTNIKKSIEYSDILFITVGTPMNKDRTTNLDSIYEVAKDIGLNIKQKKIIITKSTVPPGETFNVKQIIKKEISKRNEKIEFQIANNPEFLKEGKGVNDFMSPDRIIIGLDDKNLENIFKNMYRPFSVNHKKLIFMDILSSELTKYAANAMLATRISFMNEISIIADKIGADINNVRQGIGSDNRIGFDYIYPSAGYGGSCFKKDLNSLINFAKFSGANSAIIKKVEEVNEQQKEYFFNKIIKKFKKNNICNKVFCIWGLSFKPGTNDVRDSVSIFIIDKILELGGSLNVYDPHAIKNVKKIYKNENSISYYNDKYEACVSANALVLLTEWPEFRSPNFNILKKNLKSLIVFDGKNQYNKHKMKDLGFEYYQIGVPLL